MPTYFIKSLYLVILSCTIIFLFFLKDVSPKIYLFDELSYKFNDDKYHHCGKKLKSLRCAAQVNSLMLGCNIKNRAHWTNKDGVFIKYSGSLEDLKRKVILCAFNIAGDYKNVSLIYQKEIRNITLLILLFITPIFLLTVFNRR